MPDPDRTERRHSGYTEPDSLTILIRVLNPAVVVASALQNFSAKNSERGSIPDHVPSEFCDARATKAKNSGSVRMLGFYLERIGSGFSFRHKRNNV